MRVGMPRGIMFYRHFPFWRAFFGHLDTELVASEPTNKKIVELGLQYAESEFCLPLKVFYGHALSLKDDVDCLLIPRMISVRRNEYTCPKMLGLPDLIRNLEDQVPVVVSPTIDLRDNRRGFYSEIYGLGRQFTSSTSKIIRAYRCAVAAERSFHRKLISGMTPPEAIEDERSKSSEWSLTIGLVGHPYNIYDPYITMSLLDKLKSFGVRVLVPEHLDQATIDQASSELSKDLFWTYEKEMVGAAFHWLKDESVQGVIYVLAFACGPDSFVQSLIEHRARQQGRTPLMSLVIDEHSTEVGMLTRLEAFLDMLRWRNKESARHTAMA